MNEGRRIYLVAVLIIGFHLGVTEQSGDVTNNVRILYNIGHMANDIPQIDQFLEDGANAVEVDVRFQQNGIPTNIYHGAPCDCFRNCHRSENVGTFLNHMRKRSTPGSASYTSRLAVVFLDLKLGDVDAHRDPLYAAGDALATQIIERLYENGRIWRCPNDVINLITVVDRSSNSMLWLIIGIPYVSQSPTLEGFRDAFTRLNVTNLLNRIGYEVTEESNMDVIQQSLRGLDIDSGIWQGDGVTNCVAGRTDARLRQALVKRDAPSGPWVKVDKVYRWTIDTKTAMRHSLRLGVDGIMTNDPDDVAEVVLEPEFVNRYRLATNADNPLSKIIGPGPLRVGCSRDYCWKDCTFTGKWCWTAVSGCSSNPDMCNVNLECSGSCGKKKK